MTLCARELPLPPRPLALARRLAGSEREFALLWSASGDGPSFIAARPLAVSSAIDPEPALGLLPSAGALARAPRWIGLVPYEALRALERPASVQGDHRPEPQLCSPTWWRLGAVVCVGERVTVVGDDPASVDDLSRALIAGRESDPSSVRLTLRVGEAPARHAERVRAALELIRRGEVYQVNLARRLELDVGGTPLDLLATLCRGTRPPYAAAFAFGDTSVVSTSPELLLEVHADRRIRTRPIKGTRPRGGDAAGDARARSELDGDPKERAELNMIVDVERNDIGRVARVGSVASSLPRSSSHGLVWHRHADVSGQLAPEVSRRELLQAILPSGSVTGAPKVRAMEIIATLEAERRGLYTGGLGFINHAGEITLAMAIRTLTTRAHIGHYFTGGGIVADSDPEREVEETMWKARQLFGRAG